MDALRKFPLILPILAVLALAACASPGGVTAPPAAPISGATAAPTLHATITQGQAIDTAVAQARGDQVTAPLEEPRNPQAELMTLAAAYQRLAMQALDSPGQTQDGPAWLVTLEGSWQIASTGAADAPTPEPYHHYWVILDATTGALVTYTVGP